MKHNRIGIIYARAFQSPMTDADEDTASKHLLKILKNFDDKTLKPCIKVLKKGGVLSDDDLDMLLIFSVKKHHQPLFNCIIDTGIDVNRARHREYYEYEDTEEDREYVTTALHLAVNKNPRDGLAIASKLLEKGADVNALDSKGRTPLFVVCKRGGWNLNVFFEYKAAVNVCMKDGETLLTCNLDISTKTYQLLVDNAGSVDVPNQRGETPLLCMLKRSDFEKANVLINAGANVDIKDRQGVALLLWACSDLDEKTIEGILEKRPDVNIVDKNGTTPLAWACKRGFGDVVSTLLEQAADVNARDSCGRSPLWWAVYLEETQIVRCLLDAGAEIDENAFVGMTVSLPVRRLLACSKNRYTKSM